MGVIYGSWLGKNLAERVEEYEKQMRQFEYEEKNPKIKAKSKEEI